MLNYTIYDNSLTYWALAVGTTIGGYLVARLAKFIIIKQLRKLVSMANNSWTNNSVKVVERVHPVFLLFAAAFLGSTILELPEAITAVLSKLFFIVVLIQIGRLLSQIIDSFIENYRTAKLEKNAAAVTMLSSVSLLLRIFLWTILLILALDNFGVNITSLVAGLGVGGIALALAVQNILGDVFASFSIVLDKPFVIGDFIIVGDHLGTVENVGLKTTRVRSLSGEQLVFSNNDLLRSRIRNFKRMYERRVVFSIGVVYQTPADKVEAIPGLIKSIIENQNQVRFDRAHFKEYGPYSLNFEIVYWVLNPDYNLYMDIQQAINLQIYKQFQQMRVEFAYPTQQLYFKMQADADDRPVEDHIQQSQDRMRAEFVEQV